MLGQWDEALFEWINSGWKTPLLDSVFWFFSLGIKTWPVRFGGLCVALVLIYATRTRVASVMSVIAVIVTNGLCDLIKYAYFGARPATTLFDINLLGSALTSSGTVSAHAANMAAVATVFWLIVGTRWGVIWSLVSFLTGVSRVYVGAHFPSQVLLGWSLGVAVGVVIVAILRFFLRRRSNAKAEPIRGVENRGS